MNLWTVINLRHYFGSNKDILNSNFYYWGPVQSCHSLLLLSKILVWFNEVTITHETFWEIILIISSHRKHWEVLKKSLMPCLFYEFRGCQSNSLCSTCLQRLVLNYKDNYNPVHCLRSNIIKHAWSIACIDISCLLVLINSVSHILSVLAFLYHHKFFRLEMSFHMRRAVKVHIFN